jgi:putative alpha-1,2-mannosidase
MPRFLFFIFCIFQSSSFSLIASANDGNTDPVEFVDPFIGTANSIRPSIWESNGGTYPGAALPFGMVQATPEGYRYADEKIKWFSFINHTSGYPNGSSGNIFVMPFVGEIKKGRHDLSSAFSHNTETAHPGYYSVFLEDSKIKTELTVTPHAGFCRFQFPTDKSANIAFSDFTDIEQIGNNQIHGQRNGWYFCAEINQSIHKSERPSDIFIVELQSDTEMPVLLKIGFSKTSPGQARSNLLAEIPDWGFEKVRRQALNIWHDQLSLIKIKGASKEENEIFYTALYHSLLDPHLETDINQQPRYSQLSPWDTFRSKQPLVTLLVPSQQLNMINSVLDRYQESGRLPAGPMTGNHNIPVIVDSYAKGITDFDVELAYKAMENALSEPPFIRPDIENYLHYGYVPAEQSYSATKTLEYAYNDWTMAEFAQLLGRNNDYEIFAQRALSYQKIFNPATKFMQAKTKAGEWVEEGFREGDKWTYSWFVPHDVQGLINLMGGDQLFADKLNTCFEQGFYVHDNEPPLHYAYLFNYAGAPGLTQKWVEEVRRLNYTTEPGGLPGNDDLGALSAWYVLSAMGFFPVCPGTSIYDLGVPQFDDMTVQLETGKRLFIKKKNAAADHNYVSAVTLNGESIDRLWISHDEIANGGVLEFEMSAAPAGKGKTSKSRVAPSLTQSQPKFEIVNLALDKSPVAANEILIVSTTIKNVGDALGVYDFIVHVDEQEIKKESVIIAAQSSHVVRTELQLYKPGRRVVQVATGFNRNVVVNAVEPTFRLSNFVVPSPPIIKKGEKATITATVQNIGSYDGDFKAQLIVNDKIDASRQIKLAPGERKNVAFEKNFESTGLLKIAINDMEPRLIRVCNPGEEPDTVYLASQLDPVLLLTFDDRPSKNMTDLTATTTAVMHNNVKWIDGLYGGAIQTNALKEEYIEIQNSVAMQKIVDSKTLSMMAWIYPMEEKNFADFFTQGDWNVLQARATNTALNFYSGGYQRGEAYGTVSDEWNRNWHHVAGVTEGNFQKLYIDGKLVAEKEMEIVDEVGAAKAIGDAGVPWNIGRNAQNPERFFNGYIDDVRIYLQPASQDDIKKIMLNDIDD